MIDCKVNFKNKYQTNNLKCKFCDTDSDDSQEHMLDCTTLGKKLEGKTITKEEIKYEDLFQSVEKQKQVTQLYTELIEIRNKIEEEDQYRTLDPSTGLLVLRNSTDDYSFGR